MGDYALAQLLVAQSRQCMEGTADLERSDALVILAFEKQPYLRPCWSLAFVCGAEQGFGGLWRGGEV